MTRKIRRHGAAPSNFQHRSGRPAWIPSPTLRKAGWRRHDFKDPRTGAWMSEGQAIDEARLVNQAVDAWRAGELVPPAWAHIAPAGSAGTPAGPWRPPLERFSIGRLADQWTQSEDFRFTKAGKPRSKTTRDDYRHKLKRLVDTLAGYAVLPPADDPAAQAAYLEAVAETRASSIFTLQPEETAQGIADPLKTGYRLLLREVGDHQASGVLAVASVWLNWCRQTRSRSIFNWAADVSRAAPPGRIRPLTWPELYALVEAAERLDATDPRDFMVVADAIVLGLDLSWNQVDRFALTWDRARKGRCRPEKGRQKTGRVGATPLSAMGRRRLARILRRHRAMAAHPTHVFWYVGPRYTGPLNENLYRHLFAEVRAEAARACPSVATATDADLRDTAFTLYRNAGLDDDMTASRTLQSRKHIAELGDKSYGEIGDEIADQGVALYDAYLKRAGVKW